ncbi:MAG: 3-carboxy-cis,cis-muconate cycloisomerase [Hyphomicrobiales bacterium]|nr:3-carboxy-cis,cis-muconate cycloisomerase [Hyphomicrobiales bacterium]
MEAALRALAGDEDVAALFSDAAALRACVEAEAALVRAQGAAGAAPVAEADEIARAIEGFRPDPARIAQGFARDGVPIPALVADLKASLGPSRGRRVHVGATSQDIVDTALTLRLRKVAEIVAARLRAVDDALAALAARDGATPLMAHTRMRRALPFTAADRIAGWRRPLALHLARLEEIAPRAFVVQLGGPVGAPAKGGAVGDAVRAEFARLLGLGDAPPWQDARDRVGEFAGWLALVCGTLGKFGQDVALMAQDEIGVARPARGGGSSSMPHKVNPVEAETLVALARWASALAGAVGQAMVHENERSGAAWTLEWLALPPLCEAAAASGRLAARLASSLSLRPDAAAAAAKEGTA